MKTKHTIYNFYLETAVLNDLRELKNKHGISMSKVVNNLLKAYIQKRKLKEFNVPYDKIIDAVSQDEKSLINPKSPIKNEDFQV